MKSKSTHEIQQNYFFSIGEGYLFIRSIAENDFNKLASGRQGKIILYSEIDTSGNTLKALLNQGQLTNIYNLSANFDFNLKCYEFIVIENAYQNIRENLVKILRNNSEVTFKDILQSKELLHRHESPKRKGKTGRPKVYRDESTNKIIGMKPENLEIVELWEAGNDIKSIRLAAFPKTRISTSKKSKEFALIRRILRNNKELLDRPYDKK